jgi:hypothetical protein
MPRNIDSETNVLFEPAEFPTNTLSMSDNCVPASKPIITDPVSRLNLDDAVFNLEIPKGKIVFIRISFLYIKIINYYALFSLTMPSMA